MDCRYVVLFSFVIFFFDLFAIFISVFSSPLSTRTDDSDAFVFNTVAQSMSLIFKWQNDPNHCEVATMNKNRSISMNFRRHHLMKTIWFFLRDNEKEEKKSPKDLFSWWKIVQSTQRDKPEGNFCVKWREKQMKTNES